MSKQRIVLYGATGKTGEHLIKEALNREYNVKAIAYDVNKVSVTHPNLEVVYGHMISKDEIEECVKGHDIVIAVHEPLSIYPNGHVKSIRSIIDGAKSAGINKLVIIAHPVYKPIENTMEFYDSWKPMTRAQHEALKLLQQERCLNWAYIYSPELEPDLRTGRIDVNGKMLMASPKGVEELQQKNYASVLLDKTIAKPSLTIMEMDMHN